MRQYQNGIGAISPPVKTVGGRRFVVVVVVKRVKYRRKYAIHYG